MYFFQFLQINVLSLRKMGILFMLLLQVIEQRKKKGQFLRAGLVFLLILSLRKTNHLAKIAQTASFPFVVLLLLFLFPPPPPPPPHPFPHQDK